MQDVENNIDELFRRAAEGYLLKTSKDEWDNIAPLLENSIIVAIAAHKKKNIKKYSASLLLLILFLCIGGTLTKHTWNIQAKALTVSPDKERLKAKLTAGNNLIKEPQISEKKNRKKQPLIFDNININQNYLLKKNSLIDSSKGTYLYNISSSISTDGEIEKMEAVNEPFINKKILHESIGNENFVSKQGDIGEQLIYSLHPTTPISAAQEITKNPPGDADKKTAVKSKEEIKINQGIYLGVIFGPSFNTVKTWGPKKPGYDIGLLAGYQISKSLAVETGLIYDRKYYFSSGKYFNIKNVSATMPVDMKVLSLEGSCTVFEIPVKIKYNLSTKNNINFFATTGISTYIITNEYNKYKTEINGMLQNITGSYNNTSRYFAASLNISLGYQSKIGSFGSVRIEPYAQIPLRGIGIGSLPVMTAGLHIGIIRRIH